MHDKWLFTDQFSTAQPTQERHTNPRHEGTELERKQQQFQTSLHVQWFKVRELLDREAQADEQCR